MITMLNSYAYCIVMRPVRYRPLVARGTIYKYYATIEQARIDAKELSASDKLYDYWAMLVSDY